MLLISFQVINFTDQVQLKQKNYNLTELKYANSVYDVRVYAKSSLAEDDMWSNFSDVTFRTLPKCELLISFSNISLLNLCSVEKINFSFLKKKN